MNKFNADLECAKIIKWAQDYLQGTEGKPLVIGISGGKDSTITAAALCEAVGCNRVLGVLMPNGTQKDIETSRGVCQHLGIQSIEVNVRDMYNGLLGSIIKSSRQDFARITTDPIVTSNAPCRCRTVALYTIANYFHGRVVNTCNMSESFVGYDTKFGDQCGDFGLFQDYTVSEVKQMGYSLGVLSDYIEKAPDDGMCGQTDEDRFGFSYAYLDAWLRRGGGCENETDKKILQMHLGAIHKIASVVIPHPLYLPEGSHPLYLNGIDTMNIITKGAA